ncbi:hypothetical protein [Yoonia sp. I 8.24]|uniref:hypothetical protein n=1 Tax=Yoonia sp. I 8.24 TaxID=1537229 RepID=UPI001EDDFAC0|nr:hypothetical protein [Yoonia sp. I 8.24]MCG3266665.1 hypothetical protein [Yoonia sp. I 8.24]
MAVFSSVIDTIDGSSDLAQAEREALDALNGLAETKKDLFASDIKLLLLDAGTGPDQSIPISSIIASEGQALAYSSDNAGSIPDVIDETISSFLDGHVDDVIAGIFNALSKALQTFLGAAEGRESQIDRYYVYATEFAIYRVDFMAWAYSISAESLKTKIQQATAFGYVRSIVDIDEITWVDFSGIYGTQLEDIDLDQEQINAARQQMQDTWNYLKGENGSDLASADAKPTSYADIKERYVLPGVTHHRI